MSRELRLHYPVEPFLITQQFGENSVCIDITSRTKVIRREVDCPSGYESLYARMQGHNGLDLKTIHGQPVRAATDGWVYKLVADDRRGIGVEVISRRRYQVSGAPRPCKMKTRYWHLDSYCVEEGQRVKAGELLGYAGSSGLSTSTHLHFEVKPVRRKLNGMYRNLLQDNGYFGAIDPAIYFVIDKAAEST